MFCLSSGWCVLRSGKTVVVCLNIFLVGGGDLLLSRFGGVVSRDGVCIFILGGCRGRSRGSMLFCMSSGGCGVGVVL